MRRYSSQNSWVCQSSSRLMKYRIPRICVWAEPLAGVSRPYQRICSAASRRPYIKPRSSPPVIWVRFPGWIPKDSGGPGTIVARTGTGFSLRNAKARSSSNFPNSTGPAAKARPTTQNKPKTKPAERHPLAPALFRTELRMTIHSLPALYRLLCTRCLQQRVAHS